MKKKQKMEKLVWAFLELVVHSTPEELASLNVSIGARRLGTTPDTLCHAFKTHHVCTPGTIMTLNKQGAFNKLIANHRAHEVKQALKILDISSNSNFSEKYRKRFGYTPKETIKRHKKSQVAADQEKSKNNIFLNSESRSNSYR
jgi:methylphosphotriester-DNA--protein-cysteine methyltransferase